MLRQLFSLALPLLLVACISSQPYPISTPLATPINTPSMRPPQVGQQWVYQVRNVFNQEIVDIVTETVVSVQPQIRIERNGQKSGRLPDEIQESWGFVLQDPQWNPPQRFQQALPLWPEKLIPEWSGFYRTRYQIPNNPNASYYWGLVSKALQWERISVPAGQFNVLKYHNENPYFESNDPFRVGNYREEDIWLAPEIGRWVVRRSFGRYITQGVFWSNAYWDDYLEWELISWK
jgi:hypothetical protein